MMNVQELVSRNFPIISSKYREFALKKRQCRACPLYFEHRQVVQSEGNAKDPTFMFIGECPGKDEVEHVRPFVGISGHRLRKELRKYKDVFRKDTVLISNVLPCRPKNNKFPDDMKLVESCTRKWLLREINMVKPKIIVTLGNPALRVITGHASITSYRGGWEFMYTFNHPLWMMATFHPSYVVRSERSGKNHIVEQFNHDIAKVANTWEDIISKDERMSYSEQEWQRTGAYNMALNIGLLNK